MSIKNLPQKIAWTEGLGLALIILFLWLDELLDFPHLFFGAPATPVNWQESLFESVIVIVLGGLVLWFSFYQARKVQSLTREKDQLLGLLSHDLRSPFTSLLLNAELLCDALAKQNDKALFDFAADIYQSGQRYYQQLDDLLKWVQLQFGHIRLNPQPCVCHEVIEKIGQELAKELTTKRLDYRNLAPPKLKIMADDMALQSVLRNLLSNAIKFSHHGGKIEISAIPAGEMIEISVRDYGIGMNEEVREQLLGVDGSPSRKGTSGEKGCGLGLLLCRRLLELSGSQLQVESSPGQGSCFHFHVPASGQ